MKLVVDIAPELMAEIVGFLSKGQRVQAVKVVYNAMKNGPCVSFRKHAGTLANGDVWSFDSMKPLITFPLRTSKNVVDLIVAGAWVPHEYIYMDGTSHVFYRVGEFPKFPGNEPEVWDQKEQKGKE